MRLAELELMGFKSFPSRTALNFNSGITSIVGPNGCGKSNLVDSIRWVLGEQSAKSLRGERMESVIFTGSNSRNAGSLAEVSLMIESNGDPALNGSEKTKVTRRLYRSGESEYMLNGVPCLLRDITELFADTGVGASAYTVMEQGMVEALISDKDESRREVFDEAAGITKYKLKRRLAARKLEGTEADLLRLTDLVTEVEKQVSSLKRQMRKAEGYKKIKDELKDLELKVYRKQLQETGQKLQQLEQNLQTRQTGKESTGAELATNELELEQLKLELVEIEKTTEFQRTELDEISGKIFQKQEAIAVARQKLESLKDNLTRLESEVISLRQLKKELEQSLSNKKVESVTVLDRLEKVKAEQKVLQAEVEHLQAEVSAARQQLEELNLAWSQKSLVVKEEEGKLQALRQREAELKGREKELEVNLESSQGKESQLQLSLQGKESQAIQLQSIQTGLLNKKKELTLLIDEKEGRIDQLQKESGQIEGKLASEIGRKEVLQQVWNSYQGYQEGVRKLVEQKEKFGLWDTVANLLKTEEIYTQAVEAALGEKAEYLVASNWEKALNAIQTLQENEWGQAGFVIAESQDQLNPNSSHTQNLPKGLTPLSTLIAPANDSLNNFHQILLDKIFLVESAQKARELLSELPPDIVLVTPQGEVLSGIGIAKGGKKKGPSLLGRQEQIQQAEQRISQWQKEAQSVKQKLDNLGAEVQTHKEELEKTHSELEQLAQKLHAGEVNLTEFRAEQKHNLENLHAYREELTRLEEQKQRLSKEVLQTEIEIALRQEELNQIGKELNGQKELLRQKENQFVQISQKNNDKLIELITLQGQKERLENDSLRLIEAISRAQTNVQDKLSQKESTIYEFQQAERQIQVDQEELKKLSGQKEELSVSLNQQLESQHRLLEQINHKEQELKVIRKARSEGQEEIHQLELSRQELDTKVRQLKDKIWEEYEVDLERVPDLEASEIEQLPQYQEEIYQLRNRLKNYGAVNLLALEDYQREKERFDFLQKQVQDLVTAKETLQSTITKINDTARSLFWETFQQVRANFQEVLAGLFEGGEADLILEVGIDPLEAKIEIMAKPRGKKLVTLAQLSGGEKALVAISLLFSLYLVKPSPFCILDEVDAPLDDSNIGRFIKLIRKFTDKTQFIIITHNKLTMEAADTLYGVTMIEPGVSQIVSVRLNGEPVSR
jgi:chromosome segregation protein